MLLQKRAQLITAHLRLQNRVKRVGHTLCQPIHHIVKRLDQPADGQFLQIKAACTATLQKRFNSPLLAQPSRAQPLREPRPFLPQCDNPRLMHRVRDIPLKQVLRGPARQGH